jgi:hypothetical protein
MTALETPRPTLEKREWGTLRVSIPSLKLLKLRSLIVVRLNKLQVWLVHDQPGPPVQGSRPDAGRAVRHHQVVP